jgi:hypothetical protein
MGHPATATRYTPAAIAPAKLATMPARTARGVRSPACVTRVGPSRSAVSAPFS